MKFQVIEPMMAFSRPLCIEREVQSDTGYYRHGPGKGDIYCYIQYTLSGRGIYKDSSGTYSLETGKMLLGDVRNSDYEYYYPQDATEPWEFIWFGFVGESARLAVTELIHRHGPVFELPSDTGVIPVLMKYQNYNGLTYEMKPFDGMILVTEVLTAIAASCWSQHPQDSRSILVRKVQRLIADNLDSSIRVESLASQLNTSREHLSRVFKKHIGMTLQNYILRQKILLACKLLKETNLSSKEVSARLGYDDPSQFTRSFNKLLRIPPTQFRRMKTNVIL